MATVQFTVITGSGLEHEHELPARMEVCPGCEGHGTHLTAAIRDHAYSAEEFAESFDDEEREEYFRHGGRYDVQCETCKGLRVVPVVDEDEARRTLRGRRLFALYEHQEQQRADWAREQAAERRYGY